MEDSRKRVVLTSPISFIAEVMLVLFCLSGISVIGVHLAYFSSISFLCAMLGLFVGLAAVLLCLLGIYVLLYHDYYHLKLFTTFLSLFLALQLTWIIYLYFFANNLLLTIEQEGSVIALDVCFGFNVSALIALAFHLKQKGSTIEMVKL